MGQIDVRKLAELQGLTAYDKVVNSNMIVVQSKDNKYSALFVDADADFDYTPIHEDEETNLCSLGKEGAYEHKYVRYGSDDKFPIAMLDRIGKDETISSSLDALKRICYGGGIRFYAADPDSQLANNVTDWFEEQDLPITTIRQAKNYKTFAWNLDVIIVSNDGTKITDLYARDVEDVRLAPHNKCAFTYKGIRFGMGKIPFAYYGKFCEYTGITWQSVEIIPLLDERRPLQDLKVLMGKERDPMTGNYLCEDQSKPASENNAPICKLRKFGILRRMPCIEHRFYPFAHGAVLRSKWYRIKHLVEVALMSKISNNAQLRYLVKLHPDYWIARANKDGVTAAPNTAEFKAFQQKVQQEITNCICGSENTNKTIFSGKTYSPNRDGLDDMIQVEVIDTKIQGGDFADEVTSATNMLCYGMGVHPSLVGAVPGKSGINNSGSDKRELYNIVQTNETSTRDVMLTTYKVILAYNGWKEKGVRACFVYNQLVTLDEHTSTKPVEE